MTFRNRTSYTLHNLYNEYVIAQNGSGDCHLEHKCRIEFYIDENGKNSVQESLYDLCKQDKIVRRKVEKSIKLLQEFGNIDMANNGRTEKLHNDLWELKAEKHIRILFVPMGNSRILFLHAFKKNKRETPKSELEKAEMRWKDYQLTMKVK